MLNETTCPLCGRRLDLPAPGDKEQNELTDSIWAVAHYLAHLVQQNQKPSFEKRRAAIEADWIARGIMPAEERSEVGLDKPNPKVG